MNAVIEQLCAKKGWTLEGQTIRVPLQEGRRQDVRLQLQESGGVRLLRLLSKLGDARKLDDRQTRAALRLNWTLPYGAVALAAVDGGPELVCLVATAVYDDKHPERLEFAISHLASAADQYEKNVFHTDDY